MDRDRPSAPGDLGTAGAGLWRRMTEAYEFDAAELELLASACRARDLAASAKAALEEQGPLSATSAGVPKANPAAKLWSDATALELRALRQLGLPVAARPDRTARGKFRGGVA